MTPILERVPALLGLLNRNITSSTYGCFDREFWHYNTSDFACARKQEGVLTLTLLYQINNPLNIYHKNKEILEYIKAALSFWVKIQNSNGSFNEWYPNENSFVVTAFSTYAVSESMLLIGDYLPEEQRKTIIKALIKAGNWLLRRHEMRVMNQQTGAIIALLNIYLVTREVEFLQSSKDKIELLQRHQSKEGWLIEYGGPDIGYLSLAIDYLSKYFMKTGDENVRNILNRSLHFITYFIQPNLSAGGEYASRNTEYLIPHGFEICSTFNEDARFAASVNRKALLTQSTFPVLFDDRYFTYVGYTWLQAYLDADSNIDSSVEQNIETHFNTPFIKYFDECGLYIHNDKERHCIINTKKGGAFRLYDKASHLSYSDSGILINSENVWYTSGWLSEANSHIADGHIYINGKMWKVPDRVFNPFSNIILRIFQLTIGQWSVISLWLKERLRDLLITKAKSSKMQFRREIMLSSDSDNLLQISDDVTSEQNLISSAIICANDTNIYVPSSRYFVFLKGRGYHKTFPDPTHSFKLRWKILKGFGLEVEK